MTLKRDIEFSLIDNNCINKGLVVWWLLLGVIPLGISCTCLSHHTHMISCTKVGLHFVSEIFENAFTDLKEFSLNSFLNKINPVVLFMKKKK